MNKSFANQSRFKGLRIALTGANGSLGKFLINKFKEKGAYIVGLTHSKKNNIQSDGVSPDDWISWSCGEEKLLARRLANFDILILNHGFNPKENIDSDAINKALEINTTSHWKLIQIFEELALNKNVLNKSIPKEIWVNTSEAEMQIAFSPVYEITKHLTGELVSLKRSSLLSEKTNYLLIKKLILGPFKSQLNPQGLLSPEYVAGKIIQKAEKEDYLIIVTPNPITHLVMPLIECIRIIYLKLINKIYET